MKKNNIKTIFSTVSDILFVLILCFVVLLTTMLITRSADTAKFMEYKINPIILAGVVLSQGVFLGFVMKNSLTELREMVNLFFKKYESGQETKS